MKELCVAFLIACTVAGYFAGGIFAMALILMGHWVWGAVFGIAAMWLLVGAPLAVERI